MMPLVLWFAVVMVLAGIGGPGDIHADRNHSDVRVRVSHTRTVTLDWVDSIKPRSLRTLLMSAAVIGVRSVLPPTLPLVAQTAIAIAVRTRQPRRGGVFVFRARVKSLILVRAPASAR